MATRELADDERRLLDFLLSPPFRGRDELAAQALTVQTAGLSCGCGCPSFSLVPDRLLPPAVVDARVPIEAHGEDPAGNQVGVLLFVDDGYLSEVEVYSIAGDRFGGVPDPRRLRISEWSEPDTDGARHLLDL